MVSTRSYLSSASARQVVESWPPEKRTRAVVCMGSVRNPDVALPLGSGGEQLRDAAVEGDQPHAVAHGQCEEPGIGDLPMPAQAAGATAQYLLDAEIQREEAMLRMRSVAQQDFGDLAD